MTAVFHSDGQARAFEAAISALGRLGYSGDLLQRDYAFDDWFLPDRPRRVLPAAAFAQTPLSYDSACFAVAIPNGVTGSDLVSEYRALGAPFALEVRDNEIVHWRVGLDANRTAPIARYSLDAIDRAFADHVNEWSAAAVLRAKNLFFGVGPRQLDFIDAGLVPSLEALVRESLDRVLGEALRTATDGYRRRHGRRNPPPIPLFRLVFRLLAAKTLHDRGVSAFSTLSADDVDGVLARVDNYYRNETVEVLADQVTRLELARAVWGGFSFANLSVEILAYIYENTLVDPATRRALGIHSTPPSVARYIVHHLPLEDFTQDKRRVVEPCSGHGIFLVAALQRLRELLPATLDARQRHQYFVKMLSGFEIDPFAAEVSQLCLILADFPNHNGWQINREDVFSSERFTAAVSSAAIVVGNPPFEDFSGAERARYRDRRSDQKPIELAHRVLDALPQDGMVGLVLPATVLTGKSYQDLRERFAIRFHDIETVALPDRVFERSQVESALLIARRPRGSETTVSLTFTDVAAADAQRFLREYAYTRRERADLPVVAAKRELSIRPLRHTWAALSKQDRLESAGNIARGVQWQSPFDPARYLSPRQKPGFARGLHNVADVQLFAFQAPHAEFVSTKAKDRLLKAWDLPWHQPKVILNKHRVSRGPWRIAAFFDETGLIASDRFWCVWPSGKWTVKALAAVLNGPVAEAFLWCVEGRQKDVYRDALKDVPLPVFTQGDIAQIERLVDQYVALWATGEPLRLRDRGDLAAEARAALLRIDAHVLRGYDLSPRREREVLDLFRGHQRPVPFVFDQYFEESFTPALPLWLVLSDEYANIGASRLMKRLPAITDPVLIEALREIE